MPVKSAAYVWTMFSSPSRSKGGCNPRTIPSGETMSTWRSPLCPCVMFTWTETATTTPRSGTAIVSDTLPAGDMASDGVSVCLNRRGWSASLETSRKSARSTPVTGSLNSTSNARWRSVVAWAAPSLRVIDSMTGGTLMIKYCWSTPVVSGLASGLPAISVMPSGTTSRSSVPPTAKARTVTLYWLPERAVTPVMVPTPVPFRTKLAGPTFRTDSLNLTLNVRADLVVDSSGGSALVMDSTAGALPSRISIPNVPSTYSARSVPSRTNILLPPSPKARSSASARLPFSGLSRSTDMPPSVASVRLKASGRTYSRMVFLSSKTSIRVPPLSNSSEDGTTSCGSRLREAAYEAPAKSKASGRAYWYIWLPSAPTTNMLLPSPPSATP